ncbi:MAG TPA: hypothetical protein EYG73_06955 [Arcobacter sp.]|nr:hypothetical protein [Arcobacter sp.]
MFVNKMKRIKLQDLILFVLFILISFFSVYYIYSNGLNNPPIRSDGFGYYSYLTSIFIDNNLSFHTAIMNMHTPDKAAYGLHYIEETGHFLNKYTIGTAILQIPTFLIGHLFANIFNYTADGYSLPYQIANISSGIIYCLLGMYFLYRTLLIFFEKEIALFTIVIFLFATSLFHYATYDSSFSHVYSFFLISLFSYIIFKKFKILDINTSILLGIIFGLIVITRIPNAILLILCLLFFIPYIKLSIYGEKKFIHINFNKDFFYKIFLFSLIALAIISIQLIYWYYAAGSIFINSYKGESFNFLDPEIFNYLFSVRKGLFFWSPVLLFSILGFFILIYKKQYYIAFPILSIFLIHVYVSSSWWSWYFGGSFGNRPTVDILSLLALPFAAFIKWIMQYFCKSSIYIIGGGFIALNIIFMFGYWKGYIPFDGTTIDIILELPVRLFG